MFFPPVCRWKNNLYELHRYRKLCRRDTDGSDNARTGAVMEVQETDNLGVQLISTKHPIGPCSKPWKIRYAPKATAWPNAGHIAGNLVSRFRELYPVRFPWLNSTQETAVNKVLCARDVAIVHGPPGTGKNDHLSGSHL